MGQTPLARPYVWARLPPTGRARSLVACLLGLPVVGFLLARGWSPPGLPRAGQTTTFEVTLLHPATCGQPARVEYGAGTTCDDVLVLEP